eukprot:GILI01031411.1.p1 GENE.GILI01031411.1~~GILI01031411.1.p1  ORF type:complete len:118 (-),score=2.04 GILI01031411.1:122-475(-)
MRRHLELSRLLLWKPQPVEMISACDQLLRVLPTVDVQSTYNTIKQKLPGVSEKEIALELKNILKYSFNDNSRTEVLSDNIKAILREILARRLVAVKDFFRSENADQIDTLHNLLPVC